MPITITSDDLRFCFRLIHDLCELGNDPHAWNARLIESVANRWRKPAAVEIDTLPTRLLDTVNAMRRGLSRKEIAAELQISPHTVHTYERQLFEKIRGEQSRLTARAARACDSTGVTGNAVALGRCGQNRPSDRLGEQFE